MKILKKDYWTPIVDYYYDHVHWAEENPPSIYGWLKREYNAHSSLTNPCIHFDHEKDYMWFMLRWSEQCEKSI